LGLAFNSAIIARRFNVTFITYAIICSEQYMKRLKSVQHIVGHYCKK